MNNLDASKASRQLAVNIEDRLLSEFGKRFSSVPVDEPLKQFNQEKTSSIYFYNTGIELAYNVLSVVGKVSPLLEHAVSDYFARPAMTCYTDLEKRSRGTLGSAIKQVMTAKRKMLTESYPIYSQVNTQVDEGANVLFEIVKDAQLISENEYVSFTSLYNSESDRLYSGLREFLERKRQGRTIDNRTYVKKH